MSDLKTKVRTMLRDLNAIGFGQDNDGRINTGDVVNTMTGHYYELSDEAGEEGDRPTNVDIITDIMEDGQIGPIAQMVMVEAIRKYVDVVATMNAQELGAMPMIHPITWIKACKQISDRLKEAYK